MLQQTENTKAFLGDMRRLIKTPKSKADRKFYASKRNIPNSVERLYSDNTDDFEPIAANRQHLLNTLVPMIYSIARKIAGRFGDRIEIDDCINSGMIGAALATDRYIHKSLSEKQPAKLSSYAYSYIEKYINEHCREVNSLLSHGTTEWITANKSYVKSGNELVGDSDGKKTEFFDIAPSDALKTRVDEEYQERVEQAKIYATKLFSPLTKEERQIVLMHFGISMMPKSTKQIAKKLDWRIVSVERKLKEILTKMRNAFEDESEISEVISTLSSVNINKLIG